MEIEDSLGRARAARNAARQARDEGKARLRAAVERLNAAKMGRDREEYLQAGRDRDAAEAAYAEAVRIHQELADSYETELSAATQARKLLANAPSAVARLRAIGEDVRAANAAGYRVVIGIADESLVGADESASFASYRLASIAIDEPDSELGADSPASGA